MRIMGLDFGSKTVGVAVSDPLLLTAQGIEIIRRKEENKLRRTLARIEELILEYEDRAGASEEHERFGGGPGAGDQGICREAGEKNGASGHFPG